MTIRIALALLLIVPAAMAYPWESDLDWWLLGIAVAVTLVVFAWWRGLFVTTMILRRVAIWRRNHVTQTPTASNGVTVVLRVDDPAGVGLRLPLVAGYVDRFGVRCEKVRVTNHEDGAARTTWISMTVGAVDNLTALRARSAQLPLDDTAEIVGRRLADHLRETGLSAVAVDEAQAPLTGVGTEKWRAVHDDDGFVSAYAIRVDDALAERLADIRSQPAAQIWTALEFSGTAAHPTVRALCAFRTAEPVRGTPVTGLLPQSGIQRPLLNALAPSSTERLPVASTPLPSGFLESTGWPVGGRTLFEHEGAHEAGHPA